MMSLQRCNGFMCSELEPQAEWGPTTDIQHASMCGLFGYTCLSVGSMWWMSFCLGPAVAVKL